MFIDENNKSKVFAGTAEYISPELIRGEGAGLEADWWTLGVLLYEMLIGKTPFEGKTPDALFEQILKSNINLNYQHLSYEAKDLISRLLNPIPKGRLGYNGAREILSHPFFYPLDINLLLARKIKPPFLPRLRSLDDTKYFDSEFLEMDPTDSCLSEDKVNGYEDPFKSSPFEFNRLSKSRNLLKKEDIDMDFELDNECIKTGISEDNPEKKAPSISKVIANTHIEIISKP